MKITTVGIDLAKSVWVANSQVLQRVTLFVWSVGSTSRFLV